jgi:3-deoxy-D-manno-octulosonic-acid transferase
VGRELEQRGVPFVYRREITATKRWADRSLQALVVNTTGELKSFYEEATVIFVGKSLAARGGQNPLEPGALGKAIVFGPHMQNFEAIAAAFVREDGAVQVPDAAELERVVGALLADAPRRAELGANALRVVKSSTGAIERTVDMIVRQLPPDETYVVPGG